MKYLFLFCSGLIKGEVAANQHGLLYDTPEPEWIQGPPPAWSVGMSIVHKQQRSQQFILFSHKQNFHHLLPLNPCHGWSSRVCWLAAARWQVAWLLQRPCEVCGEIHWAVQVSSLCQPLPEQGYGVCVFKPGCTGSASRWVHCLLSIITQGSCLGVCCCCSLPQLDTGGHPVHITRNCTLADAFHTVRGLYVWPFFHYPPTWAATGHLWAVCLPLIEAGCCYYGKTVHT